MNLTITCPYIATLTPSKSSFSDVRHRALTHNSWYIGFVIEQIFGGDIHKLWRQDRQCS